MLIKKIILFNFKSFKGKHVFDLRQHKAGLHFLTGDNLVEPDLGANGCLVGSTLIDTPRDLVKYPLGIPIRNLVGKEIIVYSYDTQARKIVLKRAFNIRKTGIKKAVYRVCYSSKTYGIKNAHFEIILTSDHLCMLRDGQYKSVKRLHCGDSLMPFYRTVPDSYAKIALNNGEYVYEHKYILASVHPDINVAKYRGHHKDHNKLNNNPTNLEPLKERDHGRLHCNDGGKLDKMIALVKTNHPRGMLGKKHTKETKRLMSENCAHKDPDFSRRHRLSMQRKDVRQKISTAGLRYSAQRSSDMHMKNQREYICRYCGNDFIGLTNLANHRKYHCENHEVISVEFYGYKDVYDMEVENTHNFVANGIVVHNSGKSTLWDAVFWCFFGRTERGLKAGNVVNWDDGKSCKVRVEFRIKDRRYRLIRAWYSTRPNSLKLISFDGKDKIKTEIAQERVTELIGFDLLSFQNSVLIGQCAQMFFDLQPTAKLLLFSQVLNLESWIGFSDRAKSLSRRIEDDLVSLRVDISGFDGRLSQINSQIDTYKKGKEIFETSKEAKLKILKNRKAELRKKAEPIEEKIEDQHDYVIKLEKRTKAKSGIVIKLEKKMEKLTIEERELSICFGDARKALSNFDSSIEKYKSLTGNCPYCKQLVSKEIVKELLLELKIGKVNAENTVKEIGESLDQIAVESRSIVNRIGMKNDKIGEMKKRYIELCNELYNDRDYLRDYNSQIKSIEERLKETKAEINPYSSLLRDSKAERKELRDEIDNVQKSIWKNERRKVSTDYWVKGFKEIRLFIVEEALDMLEIEINNNLIQLGLRDWKISFDVERETKSGGVSKGFQVFITSPNSPEMVPWEAWSGGETQRLLLAGTMGLADLILGRQGAETNIEVWDEPSQHLSQTGIEDLMDLLYYRARDTGKQIWLVDHRNLDYANFASITKVIKDKDGSHIQSTLISGE